MRKVKKNVRNSNVSSSPSLKRVKVANLRKIFEPGLTDRDALTTTSQLTNRSENKSELNPSKCADQWQVARQNGPRKIAESGMRPNCDWTEAGLVGGVDQPQAATHHQDGDG